MSSHDISLPLSEVAGFIARADRVLSTDHSAFVRRALRAFQTELDGFHAALANRDWIEVRARLERGKAFRTGFRP